MWGAAPEPEFAEPEQAHEYEQEHAEAPEHEPDQDVPVLEPAAELAADERQVDLGRIDDLLHRIQNGASSFAHVREQLNEITGKLHAAEETIAERDHRLAELGQAHEIGERRIEELVGQLREREEALSGLGQRVEELTGRLSSTEERLEERSRFVDELSQQVERRDAALGAFEERLAALAAQFEAVGI
jgi:chromosome segregation ATPase